VRKRSAVILPAGMVCVICPLAKFQIWIVLPSLAAPSVPPSAANAKILDVRSISARVRICSRLAVLSKTILSAPPNRHSCAHQAKVRAPKSVARVGRIFFSLLGLHPKSGSIHRRSLRQRGRAV